VENLQRNLKLVRRVEQWAAEKKCPPAQLALAWLLAQGRDIVPIPGTRRRARLEENVAAIEVELTQEDLQRLDSSAPKGAAHGDRYRREMMQLVNQ